MPAAMRRDGSLRAPATVAIPPKATVCCAAAKCRYGPIGDIAPYP